MPRGLLAGALLVLVLGTLSASLIGGKVLSPGDYVYAWPPFSAERPANYKRPSNHLLTDPVVSFEPDMLQSRADLHAGRLPLWNPYVAAGHPLLGSELPATVFPLTWLAFILPFWPSLAWIAALKLVLAALGTYLLARELALRRGPALLAAASFAFSAYFFTWLEHTETNVWLVLPWLFLAVRRTSLRGRVLDVAFLGACVGLTLMGGHPESSAFTLMAATAYGVFQLITQWRDPAVESAGLKVRVGMLVLASVLGAGLAAIVSVPFFELLAQSTGTKRGNPGMPLNGAYSFFFPELWGRPDKAFSGGGPANFQERTVYFGALPLLLALTGIRLRAHREQWFFAALGAAAIGIAFQVPLIAAGVRKLPGTDVPDLVRMLILVVFAGAILAGYGLQRWLGAGAGERLRMLAAMAGLALIPPIVWVLKHPHGLSQIGKVLAQLPTLQHGERSQVVVQLGSVWRWVVTCAIGLGGLAILRRRRELAIGAIALVVGLTAADLVTLDRGYHPAVSEAVVNPPAPPALRYLEAHQGNARIAGSNDALPPNLASRYGLRDARIGADLPFPVRQSSLWGGLGGATGDQQIFDAASPRAQRLADVFGARYVLLTPRERIPKWLLVTRRTRGGTVALDPTALPRAWVAYSWRQSTSRIQSLSATLATPTATLRDQPVIEGAEPPPPGSPRPATVASVTREEPGYVSITADAARPGYLILDDSSYPGWAASLDHRPVRWLNANENFRAVSVPAGRHTVDYRYRAGSFRAGAIVSGLCALVLVGLAIAQRPLARRRARGITT